MNSYEFTFQKGIFGVTLLDEQVNVISEVVHCQPVVKK